MRRAEARQFYMAVMDGADYPVEIPDAVWRTICNNRNAAIEFLRSMVRATKVNIYARMSEG